MSAPCTDVCSPWATANDVCAPCDGYDAIDPIVLEDALMAASNVLYHATGRQFPGSCEDVVRPTGGWNGVNWWRFRTYWPGWGSGGYGWGSWPWAGWAGVSCGCQGRQVGCSWLPEIDLGEGTLKITEVTEVLIDGEVVDPATYRVDEYRWLVRTTPNADTPNEGWPCCQRLDLPTTEVGTMQVTYVYGTPPPAGGAQAAAALACQYALACTPGAEGECSLPERVTSVTRQGVSMVVIDPMDFLDEGKTGIYSVDQWIKSVNPARLLRPPSVVSPNPRSMNRRAGT